MDIDEDVIHRVYRTMPPCSYTARGDQEEPDTPRKKCAAPTGAQTEICITRSSEFPTGDFFFDHAQVNLE